MKRTRFSDHPCSVARAVDLMGDWWTPLVLRECFYGVRRFDDFIETLGIGRNVLTTRLARLVEEDMLTRRPYQERPVRYEYRLTAKGKDFFPVILALMRWGDDWLSEGGVPVRLVDRETGKTVRPLLVDEHTMKPLSLKSVTAVAGPGMSADVLQKAQAKGRFLQPLGPATTPQRGDSSP